MIVKDIAVFVSIDLQRNMLAVAGNECRSLLLSFIIDKTHTPAGTFTFK